MKYKRIILGTLVVAATTIIPITSMVSCGKQPNKPNKPIDPIKVEMPKKDDLNVKFTGAQGSGSIEYTTPKNTIVSVINGPDGAQGELINGQMIEIEIKPTKNNFWDSVGGGNKPISFIYKAGTLNKFVFKKEIWMQALKYIQDEKMVVKNMLRSKLYYFIRRAFADNSNGLYLKMTSIEDSPTILFSLFTSNSSTIPNDDKPLTATKFDLHLTVKTNDEFIAPLSYDYPAFPVAAAIPI